MASGLLGSAGPRLPNELALIVLEHLSHGKQANKALCSLAQTCRGLQHLAEEQIYKTIELLSVKDLHAIIEAFTYRHDRVRAVQTLKILYQYNPNDLVASEETRRTFNECVAHMVNLREWHCESPFDNFHWQAAGGQEWVEHDMVRFQRLLEDACVDGPKEAEYIAAERRLGNVAHRTVGLALLESLTIHSHGATEDFWELDNFDCLFRHPNLRYLHVSCVALPDENLPRLAAFAKTTPLTTLIFDECELEPRSLLSILRTPTRLKYLTLGENVFNARPSRGIRPRLTKNPVATLEALSAVASSLESLTHHDPSWRANLSSHTLHSMRPPGIGLRDFHRLSYLECDTHSFLHQVGIMNRDFAPPNLDTLRLRRHWDIPADFWDQLPELAHYMALPSLSTLELMQSSFLYLELSAVDYICQEDRVRNRHACGYKLSKAGINLRLLIDMHRGRTLIPPYLHGETVPIPHCLYDASVVGFRRHIESVVEPNCPPIDMDECATPFTSTDAEAPETDQLNAHDIHRITNETRRALLKVEHRFNQRRFRRGSSVVSNVDGEAEDTTVDGSDPDFDGDEDVDFDDEEDDDDDDDDEELDLDGDFVVQEGVHEGGTLWFFASQEDSETDTSTDEEDVDEDLD